MKRFVIHKKSDKIVKGKGQDTKLCMEGAYNYVKKEAVQKKRGKKYIRMHSFNKYLLNVCHILDIMLDARDKLVIKNTLFLIEWGKVNIN